MIGDTLSRAGERISRSRSLLFNAENGDERLQDTDDESVRRSRSANERRKAKLPGGSKAIGAFLISLFAFTIQTEAAQYVQQTLNYRKPFLSLYLGHSSFVFLFPLYVLFLRIYSPSVPLSHQFHLIALNLHWQLSTPTTSLPRPMPDTIRRRLSSLSMRTDGSLAETEYLDSEDFDIDELVHRRIKPPPIRRSWSEKRFGFHATRLIGIFTVLTVGITIPALSWYCAVPLTTMADITTIYNTYAVWALVFSIWFLGEKWERRKVFSVLLACGGVVLVAYGGAEHRRRPREPSGLQHEQDVSRRIASAAIVWLKDRWSMRAAEDDGNSTTPTRRTSDALLGDALAFIGAVTMAAYEMAFKVVGTLPDEESQRERYRAGSRGDRLFNDLDIDNGTVDAESATLLENNTYDTILASPEERRRVTPSTCDTNAKENDESANTVRSVENRSNDERTAIRKTGEDGAISSPSYQSMTPPVNENGEGDEGRKDDSRNGDAEEAAHPRSSHDEAPLSVPEALLDWLPPPLPFGLHPIIMTSGIGLVTVCTLWIGLPIAHVLGWETFELPSNLQTFFALFLVAFSGIIFNGCFSILLALWGPVLASVSCLLTTVLVFLADILLGHDFRWISLLGCFSIVCGFAVLAVGRDEKD